MLIAKRVCHDASTENGRAEHLVDCEKSWHRGQNSTKVSAL